MAEKTQKTKQKDKVKEKENKKKKKKAKQNEKAELVKQILKFITKKMTPDDLDRIETRMDSPLPRSHDEFRQQQEAQLKKLSVKQLTRLGLMAKAIKSQHLQLMDKEDMRPTVMFSGFYISKNGKAVLYYER